MPLRKFGSPIFTERKKSKPVKIKSLEARESFAFGYGIITVENQEKNKTMTKYTEDIDEGEEKRKKIPWIWWK